MLGAACLAAEDALPPVILAADAGPPPPPPPMMPPPDPPVPIGVSARPVAEGEVEQLIALRDEALLVQTGTRTLIAQGGARIELGALPPVRAAAGLEWGDVLLATGDGFSIFSRGVLARSPLSDAFDPSAVRRLIATPGPEGPFDVWIALQDGLSMWRKGRSYAVRPAGLPVADAKLAFGAPVDGRPAVWIASGDAIYALVPEAGGGFRAQQALAARADSMAADFEGTLWITAAGALKSRGWRGEWWTHAIAGARAVAAHPDSNDAWILADQGLWHHRGGQLRPVDGAPAGIERILATSAGAAIVLTSSGAFSLLAGRSVALLGLAHGARITAPATVEIRPEAPERARTVSASLDGEAIAVGTAPWRVEIDPASLSDGSHELVVVVEYDDGTPNARAKLRFSYFETVPPTWRHDIEPLSERHCAVCHGRRGSARLLETAAIWCSDYDRIYAAVTDGRMPLPPNPSLTAAEVELLEGWRAAGCLE